MKITVHTLNAFAKTKSGGNPAGIVLNADHFTNQQMIQIAAKVGFSETVFVQKSELADVKVKFFTPATEVDLCGHATIAMFSYLYQQKILQPGCYAQETKAGILSLEIMPDGQVFMQQNLPQFDTIIDSDMITDSLLIPNKFILQSSPVQIVSTGLRDLIIPIDTLEHLLGIQPDFDKIAKICRQYNACGYHLFTMQTKFNNTAHTRNFAPLYDIPEEAATGTANGALSCYLHRYQHVSGKHEFVIEQGYSLNRPSEIFTQLKIKNDEIQEIRVGGTAIDTSELVIQI